MNEAEDALISALTRLVLDVAELSERGPSRPLTRDERVRLGQLRDRLAELRAELIFAALDDPTALRATWPAPPGCA